ncbi:MAG: hypothetical protein ACXWW2_05845 [Candidatus Deferrimicrobiaceae bacterium]
MSTWKMYVTFFQNLFDDHYTVDRTWKSENYTFVKVNDDYPLELEENRLKYDVFVEHDFGVFSPGWQIRGYCENSVLYHLYRNGVHKKHDYIGFIEYDHVLTEDFTATIRKKLDEAREETIFSFQSFTFRQLWDQAIILNPWRREKVTGRPDSKWNCVNVILKDYNEFHKTHYTTERLASKDCFPICHSFLIPSRIFEKVMAFHSYIMESGKVERYHRHNWRSPAGLMERYMAVSLALEDAPIDNSIQLEHRSLPVKVLKPAWFAPSSWRKAVAYLQKKV